MLAIVTTALPAPFPSELLVGDIVARGNDPASVLLDTLENDKRESNDISKREARPACGAIQECE